MAEWSRVEDLFHRAADLDPERRLELLDRECAGEDELRREVEALLAADGVEIAPPIDARALAASFAPPDLVPGARLGTYVLVDKIAAGGMGVVWRARRADREFEREVAIKVLRPAHDLAQLVERFTQERRTLARLAHPNVARLYDAGATPSGLPYLVLELVDGRPIDEHCDEHALTVRERIELFLQVVSAVDAAHRLFVVHRDLKPSNVLVGPDGVPKLVDFGIAKLVDEDALRAERGLTRTGVRPMTPRYASPEQVRGEAITTASDVYSLGVVLYELLCGVPPYASDADAPHAIESAILDERPERPSTVVKLAHPPVERAAPDRPSSRAARGPDEIARRRSTTPNGLSRALGGDLDAIVLCALRKEPERRYASAEAFASDLRRHLEGHPVEARPDSLAYRASKLVARHRGATVIGLAASIALVATFAGYVRSSSLARERLDDVLRLSDLARLDDFEREAETLWPAVPALVARYEDWAERVAHVVASLPAHRATLAALREAATRDHDRFVLSDVESQWQHDKTAELVARLEAFVDGEHGLVASVRRRLELARTLGQRSIDAHAAAWAETRRSIADVAQSPMYAGLDLAPQMGLVPLGRDADSKLFEFAHLATGEVPVRGADGKLVIDDASAVVLVLVPGGTFVMGAQPPREGEDVANADALAREIERPVHEVTLAPFFIGKYEVTQGQWLRASGSNPSSIQPGQRHGTHLTSLANPVETIDLREVQRVLPRVALAMPTEAQWEYAARAGTSTPWWTGADRESLRGAANLADGSAAKAGAPWIDIRDWPELEDGHVVHAKVDTLRANAFGLHHVHGNVWELCADGFVNYARPVRAGDGWRLLENEPAQGVGRGGSFVKTAAIARVSNRGPAVWTQKDETIGVRAARAIE